MHTDWPGKMKNNTYLKGYINYEGKYSEGTRRSCKHAGNDPSGAEDAGADDRAAERA